MNRQQVSFVDAPIRIAVVGAGPGGLFVSYYLQQFMSLPYHVTLLEASSRIGGKIDTKMFDKVRIPYEAGMAECYGYRHTGVPDHFGDMIDDLGLETEAMAGEGIILDGTMIANLDDLERRFGEKTKEAVESFVDKARAHKTPQEYATFWKAGEKAKAEKAGDVGSRTFADELFDLDDQMARKYLNVATASDLATPPHATSAAFGFENWMTYEPDYIQIYTIKGGIGKLPEALAKRISTKNLDLKLEHAVTKIERTPSGTLIVTATHHGESVSGEYDFVICALPNNYLPSIEFAPQRLAEGVLKHHQHYDYPAHYLRVSILFETQFWMDRRTAEFANPYRDARGRFTTESNDVSAAKASNSVVGAAKAVVDLVARPAKALVDKIMSTRAGQYVSGKIKDAKEWMNNRYGKTTSNAIIASAAISVAAVPAGVLLAEAYHQGKNLAHAAGFAVDNESLTLPAAQIQELGQHLGDEMKQAWDETGGDEELQLQEQEQEQEQDGATPTEPQTSPSTQQAPTQQQPVPHVAIHVHPPAAFGDEVDPAFAEVLFDLAAAVEATETAPTDAPTDAQKHAGNYRKGKFTWNGLRIALEQPKGSVRSGVGSDGEPWEVTMPVHYGYILGTESDGDGEHIDCFIGPDLESNKIFVIEQNKPDGETWDENKVMIGFATQDDALRTYFGSFSNGFGQRIFSSIATTDVAGLKKRLAGSSRFGFVEDSEEIVNRNPFHQSWWMSDGNGVLGGGHAVYNESSRNGVQPWGVLGWLIGGADALNMANLDDKDLIQRCIDSLPDGMRERGRKYFIEGHVKRWLGTVNGNPGRFPTPPAPERHVIDPKDPSPRLFMVGDYLFDSTVNGVLASAHLATQMLAKEANAAVVMSMAVVRECKGHLGDWHDRMLHDRHPAP